MSVESSQSESRARAAAAPGRAPTSSSSVAPAAAVRPSRSGTVLALQARALAHEHFRSAATAVVTELALRMGCERVSIGLYRNGRLRVGAMSSRVDIAEKQTVVRAIAAAMEEALDQGAVIVHPMPRGSSITVSLAHAELGRVAGGGAICTAPIGARGKRYGALLFERRAGFDSRSVEMAKDAAAFVGPVLELKHRIDQPLSGRLVEAVSPRQVGALRQRFAPRHAAALALALVLVGVALWPVNWRVIAPARVEGEGQRVIAAPVDGFVQSVALRPGETVTAGQLLLTLEDRDLILERDKASAEFAQLDKAYREALTKDDAAQIVIARSKVERVQAQLDLVQSQLERLQLKAPFDGVLLAGDWSQSVGTPVKRGQELLTLAPDRQFRVVAEVDEQDVGELRVGQKAQVLFAALTRDAAQISVTRIAPVAITLDGRNVFEVDGRIVGAADGLRPGLRGVARIDIEPSTWGQVWWHRASQWARRTLWRVLA